MIMQESVDAANFYSQQLPNKSYFDKEEFKQKVHDSLTTFGQQIEFRQALGKLECILVHDDGTIDGAPYVTGNESAIAGFKSISSNISKTKKTRSKSLQVKKLFDFI